MLRRSEIHIKTGALRALPKKTRDYSEEDKIVAGSFAPPIRGNPNVGRLSDICHRAGSEPAIAPTATPCIGKERRLFAARTDDGDRGNCPVNDTCDVQD